MITKKVKRHGTSPLILAKGNKTFAGGGTLDVGKGVSGGLAVIDNAFDMAKTADISGLLALAQQQGNSIPLATSNDSLMNEWSNYTNMKDASYSDVGGKNAGLLGLGVLKGAGAGAAAGSAIMPGVGTAVGAAIGIGASMWGGVANIFGASSKKKKLNNAIAQGNEKGIATLDNKVGGLDKQNDLHMLANYSALGGPINTDATVDTTGFANKAKNLLLSNIHQGSNGFIGNKRDDMNKYSPAMLNTLGATGNGTPTPWFTKNTPQGIIMQPLGDDNTEINLGTNKSFADYVSTIGVNEGNKLKNPLAYQQAQDEFAKRVNIKPSGDMAKFADGGPLNEPIDTTGYAKQSSDLMNKYKNLNFVQRALNMNKPTSVKPIDLGNKLYGTHLMSYSSEDGQNWAYPTIVLKQGENKLTKLDDKAAWDYAVKTGERIPMGNDNNFAEYHTSVGYKKTFPTKDFNEAVQDYSSRTNIKGSPSDLLTNSNTPFPKYAEGGLLIGQTDFTNGITEVNAGGTHELNPNEGVLMGTDAEGTPNLVEEGEVRYKDYVFSNRLFADTSSLVNSGLPDSYNGHTFAYIAENLSKESKERPNDPISKKGLEASMTKLTLAQEEFKMKELEKNTKNKFAKGGPLNWWLSPLMLNTLNPTLPGGKEDLLMRGITNPSITPMASQGITVPTPTGTPSLHPQTSFDMSSKGNGEGLGLDALRYAPVVGSGLSVLSDLTGLTNKPDYSNADSIKAERVSAEPIGNYLSYTPMDRDYYINKLNAQSGATRGAVANQSGGNRATATAGLLASDYNSQSALGDLGVKAEEFNRGLKQTVEGFNRGTNQYNSTSRLQADTANAELGLKANMTRAAMKEDAQARSSAGRSANLTNFTDNLGNVGKEQMSMNMIKFNPALYYYMGNDGKIIYKNTDGLTDDLKALVTQHAKQNTASSNKKSKGGKLTYTGGY